MKLLLAILMLSQHLAGAVPRSRVPVRQFMKQNPCPGGPDQGSTTRCRGYVVDHKYPLCAGGADSPENMQWQTTVEGRVKDRVEVDLCRQMDKLTREQQALQECRLYHPR